MSVFKKGICSICLSTVPVVENPEFISDEFSEEAQQYLIVAHNDQAGTRCGGVGTVPRDLIEED